MYVRFTDFKKYNVERVDGKRVKLADILFDQQAFKVSYIQIDIPFRKSSFLVTPESTDVSPVDREIRLPGLFKGSDPTSAENDRTTGPSPYGPVPGGLYADWRRSDSWMAKEIDDVIAHHRRYQAQPMTTLFSSRLLDYSLVSLDQKLGNIEDMILETSEWMVPYFVVQRNGERYLCPNFLLHAIDSANELVTTCIGPAAFQDPPAYSEDLNKLDENKLWQHYLRYYGQEIREATGANPHTGELRS